MKRFQFLSCFLLFSILGWAQDVSGDWYGALKVSGMEIQQIFHFIETEQGWTGTLDIPQQGAKGLPIQEVTLNKDSLWLKIPDLGVTYSARWEKESTQLKGVFRQHGFEIPLDLTREKPDGPQRPQTPKPPFPYQEEEIVFHNTSEDINLAGSLSFQQTTNPVPAVILIHGSGAHNRNEELMNHQPFWVLADYLARNGIAVLRYDKRGVEKSEGNFEKATSQDFAEDAKAALDFLRQHQAVDPQKIGLIGHSEGGLIAAMVASKREEVAFIATLASPGVTGGQILLKQQKAIFKAHHIKDSIIEQTTQLHAKLFEIIGKQKDSTVLRKELKQALETNWETFQDPNKPVRMTKGDYFELQLDQITSPWFREFIVIDPQDYFSKINVPVLVLNGSLDLQVDAQQNLPAIEKTLKKAGNKNYRTEEIQGLNHLFQHAKTGLINEYAEIEETLAPEVLEIIKKWILQL